MRSVRSDSQTFQPFSDCTQPTGVQDCTQTTYSSNCTQALYTSDCTQATSGHGFMQPTNDHDQAVNSICETGYISQSVDEETEKTSLTGPLPVTEDNSIQV